MNGDPALLVETYSDITFNGREYRGTPGMLELLWRKNVYHQKMTSIDLKTTSPAVTFR